MAKRVPRPRAARPGTSGDAPGGDPLDALTVVAHRVVDGWPVADASRVAPADLQVTLRILLAAVRAARDGQVPALGGIPAFVPARRLLERVRQAWLLDRDGLPEAPGDPAATLAVVRALEAIMRHLDDDATHRFAARLGSFDAQQLVVEMAHDMRSPLGSILILAERLRSGGAGALPPIHARQLGLIYSAAFGLSALAGDVIELARGGTSLLDAQPIPFSISDVLHSIGDILRPMAEEKRLSLRWVRPERDVRLGHPAAINRVLLNLATNAIKFTNAGDVVIEVAEGDDAAVTFTVRDTGRGIPPSVMTHLFEAFRQRQTPGDYAFSSAGLGLSICQKLVRAMGAELSVETALEQGTAFHFTLQLPVPDSAPAA